jgi:hypothetical protein
MVLYRRLFWSEVAGLFDENIHRQSGEYLASILRSTYDPLAMYKIEQAPSNALVSATKISAFDWIRYHANLACVEPAGHALCWLLRSLPQHPAFAYMPAGREQIAVALDHIGNSPYSWCFYPSAAYGCVLVGTNKTASKPGNPYEFESYEFDPEELVAPKKAIMHCAGDRSLTLITCMIGVFENAFQAVCRIQDKPFARVTAHHADAIRKTAQRLLSFVRLLPNQPVA